MIATVGLIAANIAWIGYAVLYYTLKRKYKKLEKEFEGCNSLLNAYRSDHYGGSVL